MDTYAVFPHAGALFTQALPPHSAQQPPSTQARATSTPSTPSTPSSSTTPNPSTNKRASQLSALHAELLAEVRSWSTGHSDPLLNFAFCVETKSNIEERKRSQAQLLSKLNSLTEKAQRTASKSFKEAGLTSCCGCTSACGDHASPGFLHSALVFASNPRRCCPHQHQAHFLSIYGAIVDLCTDWQTSNIC
eukprot:1156524-Pelagomonas_calceolata.AAC.7